MELPRTHLCLLFFICGIVHTGWSQKQCEVQVVRTQVFAQFDEWVLLNCTYTCSNSKPSWESSLQKRNTTEGDHWVSTEVLLDDWETSSISCISDDGDDVLQSTVTVAAYALPSKVTIDLEEELEEEQRHEVTCTVFDVAPLANLQISVIRGGKVIREQTFAEETRTGKQTLSESFVFESSRRDNLQDFYCQATLDLGTVEDNMVQSEKINVKTFARPQFPTITIKPNTIAKEGESVTVTCRSEGLPEPEYFWELPTNAHVTYSQDKSIVYIAKVTFAHKGNYMCMAQNQHGRVREEKFLEIIKNPGAQPDTPTVKVSPHETVKEGESLNLTCHSGGFPEPTYFWTIPSNDVSFSADKSEIFIRKTTSAHNGTYECEAQNTHGTVRNQVVVRIIGQPNDAFNTRPTAILLSSALAIILALL